MVVIRLARQGAVHRPKYRVTVADRRFASTGRFIEVVGYYNPFARGTEKALDLKMDRIDEWIKKGAQPTKRVKSLMKKAQESK
ncbi:MAG: 30S ribosomal protein S16 [Bdellovibrio sp.]|nr:MAG: 30S ribosomal protein S16 [Bdellovibrio sp.]